MQGSLEGPADALGSLSSTYGPTVQQAPAQSDHTRARLVRYTD